MANEMVAQSTNRERFIGYHVADGRVQFAAYYCGFLN